MSGGSAPPPPAAPDPVATAAAQAEANRKTAITQQTLNSTNQVTPFGSLAYNVTGQGPDGTPQYTATQTLAPEQQGLLNQQNEFGRLSNQLGIDQVGKLNGLLSKPVDLSNDAVEGRLFDLANKRLAPQFERDWAGTEQSLANKGIRSGTEAYTQAQDAFNRSKNDAYDQLALTGRGQSVSEILAARNQPINEITALMSGGQVTSPTFTNTPNTNVAPTDYSGIVENNYNQANANYNSALNRSTAQQASLYGALGSIGGTALGGWAGGMFKNPFKTA